MSIERLAQSETFYPGYEEAHSDITAVAFGIRRFSDGQWYDFDDSTFKASGWTTKQQALAEDDNGLWTYDTGWAIPDSDVVYQLQWKLTDGTGTYYELGPKIIVNSSLLDALAIGVQLSAQGKLDVNAECDTALSDYGANTTVPDAAGVAATPAEVATALTNIHLDHLFAADYDPASKPGVATALLNELVEDDAGVSRFTKNSLEQAPSGTGASAATIADAVWDEAIADHTVGTSFGAKNQKVVPSETIADYKATGFNTVIPDAAGVAPTAAEVRTEMEGVGTKLALALEDTNELQTNQGNWLTAATVALSPQGKLDVNAECDTALTDYGANTTVPDAAGTAPTAIENRIEMDSNSTKMTSIEGDTQDIQSRLPAALSGGNMKADAMAISTSTDAADKLEASAETIVVGAAVTGTLSTTEMTTNLTEATDDHFNGRIIIWSSGVLKDQATNVTDYDGTTKKLIYTATTEAPSDGDTFVLV